MEAALDRIQRMLSGDQLRALADSVEPHATPPHVLGAVLDGASVGANGAVQALRAAWASAPAVTGAGLALALRAAADAAEQLHRQRPQPVWTGPASRGNERLTAGILHELIAGAQERILLISFATHTLASLATDLRRAAQHGVQVTVLFETTADSAGQYTSSRDQPFGAIDGIRRLRWPAANREPGALLHAKALVIDGRRALVGSANLTQRALTANLELGLVVDDFAVARAIEDHVERLVEKKIVVEDA